MLNRRRFLAGMVGATATLTAGPVAAAVARHRERSVAVINTHTGEQLRSVYWADGRYQPRALAAFSHLLRDHRTDEVHPVDPEVLDLLVALQGKLRFRGAFQVISGYRSPQSNALLASMSDGVATRSLHMDGKAVDIRIPGVAVRKIGKAAIGLQAGGVGMYPRSNFVHVDVGRVRTW